MRNKVWAFARKHSAKKGVSGRRQPAQVVFLFVLAIAVVASLVTASSATGKIGKADLSGAWVVTLTGNTGCGLSSLFLTPRLLPVL